MSPRRRSRRTLISQRLRRQRQLRYELLEDRRLLANTINLLKDISPGMMGSLPAAFTKVNDVTFFAATTESNGRELWRSDGTEAGTVLVKDIYEGAASSRPDGLTNVNGVLFFGASTEAGKQELWRSDGSDQGTVMVGGGGFDPQSLTNVNGVLFFSARNEDGIELWKSDGTAAGTVRVRDIPGTHSACIEERYYYGYYCARSDPHYPNSLNPRSLTNVNGTLFFTAGDTPVDSWVELGNRELWMSDGTEVGTLLVKDLKEGSAGSYPQYLSNVNGVLFFSAEDSMSFPGNGELWTSDGTTLGTTRVKDIHIGDRSSDPRSLTNFNGTLFFTAQDGGGRELWRSDGTEGGTAIVKDINPAGGGIPWHRNASFLAVVNDELFFTASDGTTGVEVWKSDGTEEGTLLVRDINPASAHSNPASLTNVNGALFFSAQDVSSRELWRSDGTAAGTSLVEDMGPGDADPTQLENVNGFLFLNATTNDLGSELYIVRPPLTLDPLLNLTLPEDAGVQVINLSGISAYPSQQINLIAFSSNSQLIPAPKLLYTSPDSVGSLQFRGVANRYGNSIITVTAEHGGADNDLATLDDNERFSRSFTVTVKPVNDAAPVLDPDVARSLLSIDEDHAASPGTLVTRLASGITDVDYRSLKGIAITKVTHVDRGRWQYTLDGTTWKNLGNPTIDRVRLLPADGVARLRFVPDMNFNGTPRIIFRAWDQSQGIAGGIWNLVGSDTRGGTTAFSEAWDEALLTVNPVNDAPVLDNTLSPVLNQINEGQTNARGTLIRSLLAAAASDVDAEPLEGLALIFTGGGNVGRWEYTLDGTTWKSVGTVSDARARLLPANDTVRLRFVPTNMNFSGTLGIRYRAWDQTRGLPGGVIDLSLKASRGGTTAYSTKVEAATIAVNPVDDPPRIQGISPNLGYSAGSVSIFLAGGVTLREVDAFAGITLAVGVSAGGDGSNEIFLALDQTGNGFRVGAPISGGYSLWLGDRKIGTISRPRVTGVTNMQVAFSAAATLSDVQQFLRALKFRTTSTATVQDRVVDYELIASSGLASAFRTRIDVMTSG